MAISLVGYDREIQARKGCKRCGSQTVAWKTSSKTGKWYLIELFDFDGEWRGNYKDFHSTYCGKPDEHAMKQAQISEALGIQFANELEDYRQREERANAENARMFLKLHDLCKNDPDEARQEIADRERKIEIEGRGLTMDYMTEFTRSTAKIKQWRVEIEFMKAALGEVEYADD